MEQDHDDEEQRTEQVLQQPRERIETDIMGEGVHRHQTDQPDERGKRPRSPDEQQDAVQEQRHEGDVQHVAPIKRQEIHRSGSANERLQGTPERSGGRRHGLDQPQRLRAAGDVMDAMVRDAAGGQQSHRQTRGLFKIQFG